MISVIFWNFIHPSNLLNFRLPHNNLKSTRRYINKAVYKYLNWMLNLESSEFKVSQYNGNWGCYSRQCNQAIFLNRRKIEKLSQRRAN